MSSQIELQLGLMCLIKMSLMCVLNSVVFGRWMDKLGISAAMGIRVVMRQTFYGGYYSLLDIDMNPNPVSFSSILTYRIHFKVLTLMLLFMISYCV